jgi:hypothetical protein
MKKYMPILAIGILVLSGLGAVAIPSSEIAQINQMTKTMTFSEPTFSEKMEYYTPTIAETSHTLQDPGKPELPLVSLPIDLPFRSQNIQIRCTPKETYTQQINKKIHPTPPTYVKSINAEYQDLTIKEDPTIYQSTYTYPENWYDYRITCGLNNQNKQVTHISLYLYPVRYSPMENTIHYIKDMTITISYDPPIQPQTFDQTYDLVIISPPEFEQLLQDLVDHKNDNGMNTILKTTESIYSEYTGVDKPEQIKRFIYDYKENHDINYVLIVGGLKSFYNANDRDNMNYGDVDWHVPVRYSNIKKSGLCDYGALSDLYYADVYNATGAFDDWDSNDDGIIGHWGKYFGEDADVFDFNPDVYVGRLACRSTREVKTCVKKIIGYESTSPASKPWLRKMVGIGGRTFEMYQGQPDGEYLCDLAMTYMEDYVDDETRVYATHEGTSDPYPEPLDIIREFSRGEGYVSFEGHGNPFSWNTHKVGQGWTSGITNIGQIFYHNFRKLPIVVVGGCHNAQYNVTWYQTKHSSDDDNKFYWTYDQGTPVCFNWILMSNPWGGAIATLGCSGLGMGSVGNPVSLSGEMDMNFWYYIGEQDIPTFGQAHGLAISKFIDENSISLTEAHCITIWTSLGDPSLMIGGY